MQVPLGVQGQGAASLSPSAEHGPALSPPTVRLSPAASTQPLLWLPPWRRPRQDSGDVGQDGDGGDDGGDDDGDGESRTTLTSADTLLHHTSAARPCRSLPICVLTSLIRLWSCCVFGLLPLLCWFIVVMFQVVSSAPHCSW